MTTYESRKVARETRLLERGSEQMDSKCFIYINICIVNDVSSSRGVEQLSESTCWFHL